MQKPKWVVFDTGGVIFDWKKGMRNTSKFLNIEEQKMLDNLLDHLEHLELGHRLPSDAFEQILSKVNSKHESKKVLELWMHEDNWAQDTLSLVNELSQVGYKIAMFTNNWVGIIETYYSSKEGFKLFDHIFDSSIEGLRKPDPRFYDLVEKRLGAIAGEIYFIDDSEANIRVARDRNWQTYHYFLNNDDGLKSNDEIRNELLNFGN